MPELDPELAEKVLSADLRNVVKKVGDGATLPSGERALIEKQRVAKLDAEKLEELRISSILRLYAEGKTLTKAQLESVRHLLPDPRLVAAKTTRTNYLKPLIEYEEIYGVKKNDGRTIKRWLKKGREKNPPDLPPLDEPHLMATWWSRNMKHKVPERILKLATSQPDPSPEQSDPAKPQRTDALPEASVPPPVTSPRLLQMPEGSGFLAALDRARHSEQVAYAKWQEALNRVPFDPGDEEMKQRAWQRATETLRRMEKDAEDIRANDGQYVRKAEYDQIVGEQLSVMNQSIRSIMVRVATKVSLPDEWFRKCNQVFQAELDAVFATLADTQYNEHFQLEAA